MTLRTACACLIHMRLSSVRLQVHVSSNAKGGPFLVEMGGAWT